MGEKRPFERQDYRTIAKSIATHAGAIARALDRDNPRFDRKRFLNAALEEIRKVRDQGTTP